MVDTCAAEFEAETPYFYSTYEEENEASRCPARRRSSSAAGRSASARASSSTTPPSTPPGRCRRPATPRSWRTRTLRPSRPTSTPATASTSSRWTRRASATSSHNEDEQRRPARRSIVQFGGQTAINLAGPLAPRQPARSSAPAHEAIDLAEDRRASRNFLQRLGIPQPPGRGRHDRRGGALDGRSTSATPCSCAPATSSAAARWRSSRTRRDLIRYVDQRRRDRRRQAHPHRQVPRGQRGRGRRRSATATTRSSPASWSTSSAPASTPATRMAVYPAIDLDRAEVDTIVDYTTAPRPRPRRQRPDERPVRDHASGAKRARRPESDVYVIEVNPRASRTVPFISKVTGVPMVRLGRRAHARQDAARARATSPGSGRGKTSSPSRRRCSRCRSSSASTPTSAPR